MIAPLKSSKPQDAVIQAGDRAFGGGEHMNCGLKTPTGHSMRACTSAAPVPLKKWLHKDLKPAVARPVVCRPRKPHAPACVAVAGHQKTP